MGQETGHDGRFQMSDLTAGCRTSANFTGCRHGESTCGTRGVWLSPPPLSPSLALASSLLSYRAVSPCSSCLPRSLSLSICLPFSFSHPAPLSSEAHCLCGCLVDSITAPLMPYSDPGLSFYVPYSVRFTDRSPFSVILSSMSLSFLFLSLPCCRLKSLFPSSLYPEPSPVPCCVPCSQSLVSNIPSLGPPFHILSILFEIHCTPPPSTHTVTDTPTPTP